MLPGVNSSAWGRSGVEPQVAPSRNPKVGFPESSLVPYNLTGFNVINGTSAAEVLTGGATNDAIYGNGGADRLTGGLGRDVLFGGLNDVTFVFSVDATWGNVRSSNDGDPGNPGNGASFSLTGYGQSNDVFVGSGTNNTLVMPDGKNAVFLDDTVSPGVDSLRLINIQTIIAGNGGQIIDLSSSRYSYGNVTIIGGAGDDVIFSNAGTDTLRGGDGNDYVWGGAGNDQIEGGNGNDTLFGGVGNDWIDGGAGKDAMTGGAGDDTYIVDSTTDSVTESAGQGADVVISSVTLTLSGNVENLVLGGTAAINGTGNTLDNVITGNSANNVLNGGNGNDVLNGGAGNDTLSGGAGNDWLDGGTGNDTLTGGAGDDIYVIDSLGDKITEGSNQGTDLIYASISYVLGANAENLTLTGTAAINATGNTLNNVIVGNVAANVIDCGSGNDVVNAGAGADTIYGGDGNDSMFGEDGDDTIYGGAGIDNLNGGADRDLLVGGAGNDGLWGGGGNDRLLGEDGNDKLYGDGGDDIIVGGAGNDWMLGGQLANGYSVGNDTFVWSRSDIVTTSGARAGFDTIVDFAAGDRLDFSAIFAGGAGQAMSNLIHVTDTAGGTVISVHVDNTIGFVDTVILKNVHGLTLDALVSQNAIIV